MRPKVTLFMHVLAALAAVSVAFQASADALSDLLKADLDGRFEEVAARADQILAADAGSPEALATVVWLRHNPWPVPNLNALATAPKHSGRDPAVSLELARLSERLNGDPGPAVLYRAELWAPVTFFRYSGLERAASKLPSPPPLETLPGSYGKPFRIVRRWYAGKVPTDAEFINPPCTVAATWRFEAEDPLEGWIVLEGPSDFEIWADGVRVGGARSMGAPHAKVHWFKATVSPGTHSISVLTISGGTGWVRLWAFDSSGERLAVDQDVDWESEVSGGIRLVEATPPALSKALSLDSPGGGPNLLRALAYLSLEWPYMAWEELQKMKRPGDEARLVLSQLLLEEPLGGDAGEETRRGRQILEDLSGHLGALYRLWRLAVGAKRWEEADNLGLKLISEARGELASLEAMLAISSRDGWVARVPELARELLVRTGGASTAYRVAYLNLMAVGDTEEAAKMACELAAGSWDKRVVAWLVARGRMEKALSFLERLGRRWDDPAVDRARVQVLAYMGREKEAGSLLHTLIAEKWGPLRSLKKEEMELSGAPDDLLMTVALMFPIDSDLVELAWTRNLLSFFRQFRKDGKALLREARSRPKPSNTDSVLLLDQAVVRLYPTGDAIYYYHGLSWALTPKGVDEISMLLDSPGKLIGCTIIKKDGSELIPPDMQRPWRWMEPGDALEIEQLSVDSYGVPCYPSSRPSYVFRFTGRRRPFGYSEYVLLYPQDLPVVFDGNLEKVNHQKLHLGDLVADRFWVEQVEAIPSEPKAPPDLLLYPWVTYAYNVDLDAVGEYVRDLVMGSFTSGPALEKWIEELSEASGDKNVLAEVLERLEENGNDNPLSASPVGAAFESKSGGAVSLAAYALLRLGWKVDLVLTRPFAWSGKFLKAPSVDSFYVPVLVVEKGGKRYWLDPSEGKKGLNHVNPLVQGSDALLIPLHDPAKRCTYLEKVPEFPNPWLCQRFRVEGKITPQLDASLRLWVEAASPEMRRVLREIDKLPADQVDLFFQGLARHLLEGVRFISGKVEEGASGSRWLVLDVELPNACRPRDGAEGISCAPMMLGQPVSEVFASLPERRFPLLVELPFSRSLDVVVSVPQGWTLLDSAPVRLKTQWGSFTETKEVLQQTFELHRRVEIKAQTVEPAVYEDFSRFCHVLDELRSRRIRFLTQ